MNTIELRKVGDLIPHPLNIKYFLDPESDPSFSSIKESIARDGIQEPLIIKNDGTILSGNLRYAGVLWALTEKFKGVNNIRELISESRIPVRVHADFKSEADEVQYLIRSNLDRRQFTQERRAIIWDLWKNEYGSIEKRKPGRPPIGSNKVDNPKKVAAKLGITVKTADALIVVKNNPLVPQVIRMKVFNDKLSAITVAKAVTFAEEEAIREQRDPVPDDVLRYLENPPPKKLTDTIQETLSNLPKTEKNLAAKPAIIKKAAPVPAVKPNDPEPSDYYPETDEIDESELLFAGLDPTDPSASVIPDSLRLPETPRVIDLHTEIPISTIKIDNSQKKMGAWKKALLPNTPANTPEPSNVVDFNDAKENIVAKAIMTQEGKNKLAETFQVGYEKALDTLTEKSIEYRVTLARGIIEALLGDVTLNENITGNLVGLHKNLDNFLKDIEAISDVAPAEKKPYRPSLPTDIKEQLLLSRSFVSDLREVDDPEGTRDLLLDIIQEAKVSVNNLTNAKRTLEPNGLFCVDCLAPQFKTIHGDTCENGHGGSPGITEEQVRQEKAKQPVNSNPAKDIDSEKVYLESSSKPSDLNEVELNDLTESILSAHPPTPKGDLVVDILNELSDELGLLV